MIHYSYERRVYILGEDGTYGVIVWTHRGRFEFRGFADRICAELAIDELALDVSTPGEYRVRRVELECGIARYKYDLLKPAKRIAY